MTAAINQGANLSTRLVRELRKLAGKLLSQDLMRIDSPRVELFDAAKLVRLEPGSVSDNVLDSSSPRLPDNSPYDRRIRRR